MEPQTQIKTLELQIAELEKALADMTLKMQSVKIDSVLSQIYLDIFYKCLKCQSFKLESKI